MWKFFPVLIIIMTSSCITTAQKESTAAGGLKTQEVQAVVRKNLGSIEKCFEETALKDGVSGHLKFHFEIGYSGRIEQNEVERDLMETPALSSCIIEVMKTWEFPSPRGNQKVKVSYPFQFDVSDEKTLQSISKLIQEKILENKDCSPEFDQYHDLRIFIGIRQDGSIKSIQKLQDASEKELAFPCFARQFEKLRFPVPKEPLLPEYFYRMRFLKK